MVWLIRCCHHAVKVLNRPPIKPPKALPLSRSAKVLDACKIRVLGVIGNPTGQRRYYLFEGPGRS